MAAKKNVKDHRAKKNPKSAEAYQEERHKRNSERPKQIWVEPVLGLSGTVVVSGFWHRAKN